MAFALVHSATRVHGGFTTRPEDHQPLRAGWELVDVSREAELRAAMTASEIGRLRGREVFVVWQPGMSDVREATREEAGDAGVDTAEVQRRIDLVWDACEAAYAAFKTGRTARQADEFIAAFAALAAQRSRVTGLGARG